MQRSPEFHFLSTYQIFVQIFNSIHGWDISWIRNSKWRPLAAHVYCRLPFWSQRRLQGLITHLRAKFHQNRAMRISVIAVSALSRWPPSAILNFTGDRFWPHSNLWIPFLPTYQMWCLYFDRRLRYIWKWNLKWRLISTFGFCFDIVSGMGVDMGVQGTFCPTFWNGGDALCFVPLRFRG